MSSQPKISGPLSGRPGIYGGRYSKWAVIVPVFLFGVAIAVIATTLAGNNQITVTPDTFTAGVVEISSCNGNQDVDLKPQAKFKNESGSGEFLFTGFKVDGIDASAAGCAGKVFLIRALASDASRKPLYMDSSGPVDYFLIRANLGGTYSWVETPTGLSITSLATSSATSTGFEVSLPRQEDAASGAYAVTPTNEIEYVSMETD